jgi:hypothetical protein
VWCSAEASEPDHERLVARVQEEADKLSPEELQKLENVRLYGQEPDRASRPR